MVVPVEVTATHGDTCAVRVLGCELRMRCYNGQSRGAAFACLRAQDLALGERGIAARVQSVTYEGGRFRVEAAADGAAQMLHFHATEPCTLNRGDAVRLDVGDGWVIPR